MKTVQVIVTAACLLSALWLAVSLAYVAYYVVLSLYLTARRGRPAPAAA